MPDTFANFRVITFIVTVVSAQQKLTVRRFRCYSGVRFFVVGRIFLKVSKNFSVLIHTVRLSKKSYGCLKHNVKSQRSYRNVEQYATSQCRIQENFQLHQPHSKNSYFTWFWGLQLICYSRGTTIDYFSAVLVNMKNENHYFSSDDILILTWYVFLLPRVCFFMSI